MRVNLQDVIANHSTKEIRHFLRYLRSRQGDGASIEVLLDVVTQCFFQNEWDHICTLHEREAFNRRIQPFIDNLLNELVALGYLEAIVSEKDTRWITTLKGNALTLAKATPPMKRRTAEKKLAECMERVREINGNSYYLCRVKKVVLFGSLLNPDLQEVNDVDIMVELERKEADRDKWQVVTEARVAEAYKKGRTFNTFLDELEWPYREVQLFLKARSRPLSIHPAHEGILAQCDHKVIFGIEA